MRQTEPDLLIYFPFSRHHHLFSFFAQFSIKMQLEMQTVQKKPIELSKAVLCNLLYLVCFSVPIKEGKASTLAVLIFYFYLF